MGAPLALLHNDELEHYIYLLISQERRLKAVIHARDDDYLNELVLIRKIKTSQFEQSILFLPLTDLYFLPIQHFVYETIHRYLQVMERL